MPDIRHLERAPIREAVFDVRILPAGEGVLDRLRELAESLVEFPEVHERFSFETAIELGDSGAVSRNDRSQPSGFRVVSGDEKRVLQLHTKGFSYSRLSPYTSWDQIRADVEPLLEQYASTVGAEEATRLALRYINHLRLPYPVTDLAEFVRGLPTPPAGWPGVVQSFLQRLTLADATGASAHVTQALADDIDEDRIGFIFDIDAFREGRFPIGSEAFWQTFQELRDLKNRIFFNGITDRTVEMYA